MDTDYLCISPQFTIKEALEFIETNKQRAVLVVNQEKTVTGFLSQGDIIRALIAGADLNSSIRNYISPAFVYLKNRDTEKAAEYALKKGMTLFPVVDDNFKLIDIITLFDILQYLGVNKCSTNHTSS